MTVNILSSEAELRAHIDRLNKALKIAKDLLESHRQLMLYAPRRWEKELREMKRVCAEIRELEEHK